MKDLTIRKLVTCLIAFAMGLVTVCGLAVPVYSGYARLGYHLTESGFSLMGFQSVILSHRYYYRDWGWALYPMGMFAILQLLVAITTLVFSVLALLVFKGKTSYTICKVFVSICFAFLIVYAIEGLIYIFITGSGVMLAYVPLIFGLLLFIGFFVCAKKVPEKPLRRSVPYGAYAEQPYMGQPYYGGPAAPQGQYVAGHPVQQPYYGAPVPPQQPAPQPAPQPSAADSMEEKVKLLTQYKQLLDSGILTQEEFDKLKAETLGKQ